jgi:hypothetical protein
MGQECAVKIRSALSFTHEYRRTRLNLSIYPLSIRFSSVLKIQRSNRLIREVTDFLLPGQKIELLHPSEPFFFLSIVL